MTYIPSFGDDTPRKGAYGGHWNHIRAVNNYQNGTMLFIDDYRLPRTRSSVVLNKPEKRFKEEDLFVHNSVSSEPKNSAQIDWLLGFKHRSDTGLNLLACSTQANKPNLKKYENKFHIDAKEGIEYWPRLKRPQVVKTKVTYVPKIDKRAERGLDALMRTHDNKYHDGAVKNKMYWLQTKPKKQ